MAFDGITYPIGTLCYPYPAHPGAPLHDEPLASALTNAYHGGRFNSRRLITQTYAHNFTAAYLTGFLFQQADWVRVAEGYARIPALSTHLRANVGFLALPLAPGKVYHRIVVTDGSATNTGSTFERPASAYASRPGIRMDAPPGELLEIEVSLSGISLTGICRAYVQAYCLQQDPTTEIYDQPAGYRPLFACVYAEVRG